MSENNIDSASGLSPEKLERDGLIENHRRLDAEFDAVESEIDSFFRRPGPYQSPENDREIAALSEKREKILREIRSTEQKLLDLDRGLTS